MQFVATQADSTHVQSEVDKENSFIERIQHIHQQVHDILDRANAKYKQCHDQHRVSHNFQVGDKVWLHLQKECLTGPHHKLHPLLYGTITKAIGNNAFELSIPPFLGLHPIFNVDLVCPCFPPLLDTSDNAEQITPKELNQNCMEQATTDCIMDMQIKKTLQHKIQLYRVGQLVPRQLVHQGPSSTEVSSSHGGTQRNGDHFFLSGEELSRWILVATHLFHLGPHHFLFQFFSFGTTYYF